MNKFKDTLRILNDAGLMEDLFTHHGWYILGAPGSPGGSWYRELTEKIASMSEVANPRN